MSLRLMTYRVEYTADGDSLPAVITARREFGLDFVAPQKYFFGDLPPRFVDVLRVGEAIYVVDRLVRRRHGPSHPWNRDLNLRVEVLDPGFWAGAELRSALQEAIEFVTGDSLDFDFFGGSVQYEWMSPLLSEVFAKESPLVCLYSGGLDSATGLALRLGECPDRPILPVTIKHQPRQDEVVKEQFKLLRDERAAKIEPLIVTAMMNRPAGLRWSQRERSQRGQSFLFAAAGAVAAAVAGQSSVEVFESGIGSINIPLMAGMVSSMATRGCHPEFLRRMSRLVSLVAGREIIFRLPFFDRTKGEMVRALNDLGLADLVRATVSCARYPLAYHPYKQCGICPACVFRRQAIQVAGIEEPEGMYAFDLFGPAEQVNRIPPDNLNYLKAFLMQVAGWTDIETTGRLPEPAERYLRQTRILKPGDSPERIIDLLARNRDEWEKLAAEGREKGYRWARLLAPALVGQGANYAST
jgi:7-cyano-7-deazaguanine synthase in queuosine biosynthesis